MILNLDKHSRIIQPDDFTQKLKDLKIRRVNCEILDRESVKMRGFFEGGVVRYWFFQVGIGFYKTFTDARKELQKEHNPIYSRNKKGELVKEAGSTKMSNPRFFLFLRKIQDDFMRQGLLYPDNKDYNEWVNSAPLVGEIYPALIPLIRDYAKQLKEINPVAYDEWIHHNQKLIKQIKKQTAL